MRSQVSALVPLVYLHEIMYAALQTDQNLTNVYRYYLHMTGERGAIIWNNLLTQSKLNDWSAYFTHWCQRGPGFV